MQNLIFLRMAPDFDEHLV